MLLKLFLRFKIDHLLNTTGIKALSNFPKWSANAPLLLLNKKVKIFSNPFKPFLISLASK
ncbi:hypothetical protein DS891_18465 [Pseudoalteromonas sp. JC28]|nr:hypothetical protein [Pseudoalteromonas sp. JC28]